MWPAFVEALIDTGRMLPLLFVIYLLLELVERKYEARIKSLLALSGAGGPLVGALLGCVPQCGFSVIATALYAQRVVSLGTLMAVYLSTSDEAIPVILAQPHQASLVLPLLVAKIMIGIAGGYGVDLVMGLARGGVGVKPHDPACRCLERKHCCGEGHGASEKWWFVFGIYPLKHALRVFVFILIASWGINCAVAQAGPNGLGGVFLEGSLLQPLIAVLIGLIPNCAASVAITQAFLSGALGFGAAIAGLSASAGLGLLVLLKENRLAEAGKIIALLAGISFAAGIAVQYLVGG
jgi:hypothetical protein